MSIVVRDVREHELDSVLALNNAAGPAILPLDAARLRYLFENAEYFRVAERDGTLAGFLIGFGSHANHALRHENWPAAPQYEYLADTLWSDHAYGRNAVAPRDSYGNAVLSHFPIVKSRNHCLSGPHTVPQRGVLHCVVSHGALPALHLMCVHLGLLERDRQAQIAALREVIDSEVPPDAPLIVAGDFNDWRQRADARLARIGLSEVFRQTQGRHACSFPAAWPLLLDFLADRLNVVDRTAWAERLTRGEVLDDSGQPLPPDAPFQPGTRIHYYRHLDDEPTIPFEETVLFQDAHLLVADKPHFLPVTPGGRYVQQSLLVRLKNRLGIESLSPIHRIDRETAGLVLFSLRPQDRAAYQALFRERSVHKVYEAIASSGTAHAWPLVLPANRVRLQLPHD